MGLTCSPAAAMYSLRLLSYFMMCWLTSSILVTRGTFFVSFLSWAIRTQLEFLIS